MRVAAVSPAAPLVAPRLALALLPVLVLLVTAVGLVLFHHMRDTTDRLRTERLAYALYELRRVVESSLSFGLPLEVTENLAPLMTAALDRDLSVLSIDLFDSRGRLILSTDRSGIGEGVPPEWLAAQSAETGGLWRLTERGVGVIGISITNSFNQVVGGLALRHQQFGNEAGAAGAVTFATVLLAVIPAALAVSWLLFSLAVRRVEGMGGRLAKALADPAGGAMLDPAALGDASEPLVRHAAGFLHQVEAAEAAMADAAATVHRIDQQE